MEHDFTGEGSRANAKVSTISIARNLCGGVHEALLDEFPITRLGQELEHYDHDIERNGSKRIFHVMRQGVMRDLVNLKTLVEN